MECLHCNHTYRFFEASGARFCSPECQVFHRVLGDKLEPRYDDVMVVRPPPIRLYLNKPERDAAGYKDAKEADPAKRVALEHWVTIFLEFVEYYEYFVTDQMAAAGLGQFSERDAKRPSQQNKAEVKQRRTRRLVPGSLDGNPQLRQLVQTYENADRQFRPDTPDKEMMLVGRTNDTGNEYLHRNVERTMGQLRDALTALEQQLGEQLPDYNTARDNYLVLLQAEDYQRAIAGNKFMKQWDVKDLLKQVRANPTDKNRQDLKNDVMLGYTLFKYYKQLTTALTGPTKEAKTLVKELSDTHNKLRTMLREKKDVAVALAQAEQRLIALVAERGDAVKEQAMDVEQQGTVAESGEESASRSTKEGKRGHNKVPREGHKPKKPKKAKNEKKKESRSEKSTTKQTNTNDEAIRKGEAPVEMMDVEPLTPELAMQVEQPRYTPDEIAERVRVALEAVKWAESLPAGDQRAFVVQDMRHYFERIRDRGPY